MERAYNNVVQIENLIEQFSTHVLPEDKWTHQAHLTVAFWYLFNFTIDEATCYLRSGIITYNRARGKRSTPTEGYHETITLFWIKVIDNYLKTFPSKLLLESCNAFLNSKFSERNYILSFYSKDILATSNARAFWIEPNLQNLEVV
ncbi:MAG TPA: hypothetical protein VF691_16925 [Cytophagaceae bacterium]|jgi:hypothetical protein